MDSDKRLHNLYANRAILPRWLACVAVVAFQYTYTQSISALPPLGITQVDPASEVGGFVSVIDNTAYVSTLRGVWNIGSNDVLFQEFSHPTHGTALFVTRVVQGIDSFLYLGANFNLSNDESAASLFRLDQPSVPLTNWEKDSNGFNAMPSIAGIDRNQRGYGSVGPPTLYDPVQYNLDGTFMFQEGSLVSVGDVTESGYSAGAAHIPGTFGIGPAVWDPNGNLMFVSPGGAVASSVADRSDGNGINIGIFDQRAMVYFGSAPPIAIRDLQGQAIEGAALVSQSDFTLISSFGNEEIYGFYPGLVPGKPNAALLIEDIFPELATVDFNRISKPYAIDGHVFMVLSGNDGLVLFGAADPSLVPEPATAALALFGSVLLFISRRQRQT